ncbi:MULTISPECIES: hypothetical protein [unclassified Actinomadura]|uniref:hypothetical protein n=1 Tax=unclassified Actinomadura TaxID=2626254 RepID=UPI0011EC72AF|nr:hypothetical protein [Actinomadura sp. K4S16]
MTALIVFVLLTAVVLFVLGCMDQRTLYWKNRAWQYRNPEAVEPSGAAFAAARAGSFAGAVALLITAGVLYGADNARTYSTAQVDSVASAAASRLDEGPSSGLGSSVGTTSDVYDAVNDAGHGNVHIRSAGGDKYELTNRKGKNPVCLTVTVDNALDLGGGEPWSHSVSTSVHDGPC